MTKVKFGLALENFTPADKTPDVQSIVTYARRAEELASVVAHHRSLVAGRP